MPRLFQKRNGTWSEILSVFQKQGGTWTEILNIFQKIGGTWTKVFAAAKVPGNTVPPTITGSGRLYGTLTNNSLGTWTNTPTGYTRQWRRGNPSAGGGEPSGYSNISGETSSTYVTTDLDDGKYIICQVTASNAVGSNSAASNSIYVNKFDPVALGLYSLSGLSTVGSTLTALEQIGTTWKSTTNISGDTSPNTFEFEWSYSDGTIRQSTAFNSINSNTYTIVSGDLGKVIRVRVTGTNTGGTATTGYTSSATVTTVYSFNFGNTLYVGSNGYIGLDDGGNAALTPGSGRNVNIYNSDLVQYRLQEYSDSSNYYLYFRSYNYQSPLVRAAANALDYQIRFYVGQPYCDATLIRKGSAVPFQSNSPGYYGSGFTNFAGLPGPFVWGAGSVIRIYFNGTMASMSAASWTPIADTLWKNISSSDIDDSFTPVVTSANQQAPILTAPTLNSVTVGPQGGQVSANFTGGSGPFYQMFWWGTASPPTVAVTPDATRTFSPLIDSSGPTSTATNYMYVRSVQTETDTSVGPSSIASAWSNGIAFNMTSTDVTQNSAPTARATNTFSTSTVKYLDSITWSSGSYTNAASITSVLLYSTVTSNLVAPGGNTLSSFRTANPYAIVPSDPAGTPYVFAVRDTVVGTNGTTYYFYSNQITSANADAVAFSYGASTSTAGGWTASVNSGAQSGASYSFVSATAGSGTVNASTGAITASGLGSNAPSTITVNKSVSGYNTAQTSAAGTSATAATFTLTYNGNGATGGSTADTTGNGSVVLRANGFTRTNCTFQGWSTSSTGGVTNAPGTSFNLTANTTLWAVWAAVPNSATAPPGFKFDGNNLPTSGRKRWSWTGTGTVTGGVRTGFRVEISSSSSSGPFSVATGSPLATSARSYDIAVSPVTSPRWLRIASIYTDGLGVTRIGTYTTAL
jgi:hypothetical protein